MRRSHTLVALMAAIGVLAVSSSAFGYAVTYTVDSANSVLILGGSLDVDIGGGIIVSAPIEPQGGNPATLANNLTGSIKADYSGGTITFSNTTTNGVLGSLVGLPNPAGPFTPPSPPGNPYGKVDNVGFHADLTAAGFFPLDFVLRDASYEITEGTVQNGVVPNTIKTAIPDDTLFIQSLLVSGGVNSGPTINSTTLPASISILPGGTEKVIIPIRREVDSTFHSIVTGDVVLTRQLKAGDANNDGKVTGADYTLWAANFNTGSGKTWGQGDFNGDGKVTGADYTIWAANFQSGGAASPNIVPEPSTYALALVGLGALALFARRKKS